MEEIVTVDGKQFKLTTDRPLTAEQKAQTIAEIIKQTGCRTCGTGVASPNWQYGGIIGSMATGPTTATTTTQCKTGTVGSGTTVTLKAAPMGGVANYSVTFNKQIGCAISSITSYTGVTEATAATASTISYAYTILDGDVAGSTGCTTTQPLTTAGVTVTIPTLSSGYIRFVTNITDSCPSTGGGPGYCVEYCDILLACVPPTCNFIVT